MTLFDIGYTHYLKQLGLPQSTQPIARVTSENKTDWNLIIEQGAAIGIMRTTLRRQTKADQLPKVGDYVTYETQDKDDKLKILAVLPRYSEISRKLPKKRVVQILATNVDKMFVIVAADQILNTSQISRYLALAKQSGVEPILILNKIDQGSEFLNIETQLSKLYPRLIIINTSAKTKVGLDLLSQQLLPQETAVFAGSSGAGKSSLINALATLEGSEKKQLTTGKVGKDGKGRHTTTRREIAYLPSGGIIIDTPGIRTLEIEDNQAIAGELFPELENLSENCKFRDCDHQQSKGCAILAALEAGDISESHYKEFIKLQRSQTRIEEESDFHAKKLRRTKMKARSKAIKQIQKTKKHSRK